MVSVTSVVNQQTVQTTATVPQTPKQTNNVLVMGKEIIFHPAGFKKEQSNLNNLDLRKFEEELIAMALNPDCKRLILSFNDCRFDGGAKPGLVLGLFKILMNTSQIMNIRGKKLLLAHLPQELYDYIIESRHPLSKNLNLNGELSDAIKQAINEANLDDQDIDIAKYVPPKIEFVDGILPDYFLY